MNCLSCTKGDMKTYPDHAKTGLAHCTMHPLGKFQFALQERTCPHYEARPENETAERLVWLERQKGK